MIPGDQQRRVGLLRRIMNYPGWRKKKRKRQLTPTSPGNLSEIAHEPVNSGHSSTAAIGATILSAVPEANAEDQTLEQLAQHIDRFDSAQKLINKYSSGGDHRWKAALPSLIACNKFYIIKALFLGSENLLKQYQIEWVDCFGEMKSVSAEVAVFEKYIQNQSYNEAMKLCLSYPNENTTLFNYIGNILKKHIDTDTDFSNQFHNDAIYAPLLTVHNKNCAALFPELAADKEKIAKSLYLETCQYLGFDPNDLTNLEDDVVKINLFLSDENRVLEQLKQLENELNAAIEKNKSSDSIKLPLQPTLLPFFKAYKPTTFDAKAYTKPYGGGKHKNGVSFLHTFFDNWSKQNNFNSLTRLNQPASRMDFFTLLQNRTLFNDKGVNGRYHGAWTHIIQWYCITGAVKAGELSLSEPTSKIMEWLGDNKYDSKSPVNTLWDKTFEQSDPLTKHIDFRDVFALNDYLNLNPTFSRECPTTQTLINYRALKAANKTR